MLKELSIEEKAKAYDKALAIARDFYNSTEYAKSHAEVKATYEAIFPELAESGDERIRKEMIDFVKSRGGFKGEWIAWLEKQGEPKEINPSEFDSQLNRLLGQFKSLPKEELASSLSFYLNVVQNDGTYKEEKQGEQKPWSEEDENRINRLIAYFEDKESFTAEDDIVYANWLKSLKDRVQPQPRQEWSEEDEDMHYKAIAVINRLCAEGKDYVWSIKTLKKLFYWLKSLRPQNTWKPSDEQIEALKGMQEGVFRLGILESLYNDLMKLKGG